VGDAAFGGTLFKTTNLVTDDQGVNPAKITDTSLVNAWGISSSGGSPLWVSDNGTGVSTLYSVNPGTGAVSKVNLTVTIPGDGTPTGQVFNGGSEFNNDRFLFVSEDGTVSGWRGALGTAAEVLQTGDTANVYKGVALATVGTDTYLYAANFRAGTIDILKGVPGAPSLSGNFTDPTLPAGYAPFNIQLIGNKLYVTYAVQDPNKHDDVAAPGNGIVSVFDTNGNFLMRLVDHGGPLNSPWGLALAPKSFGTFAGDLLVGNFGDGTISAFNPSSGSFLGKLPGVDGNPLTIDGLWGLRAGNDGSGGNSNTLYFSAGPGGESHGLFGALSPVPEPASIVLAVLAGGIVVASRGVARRRTRCAEAA
jgi:uncharacterized protein (TIGR03118 family)